MKILYEPDDFLVFYSVEALAEMFGVEPRIIRKWITDGDLAAKKIGRSYYVIRAAVKEFVFPYSPEEPAKVVVRRYCRMCAHFKRGEHKNHGPRNYADCAKHSTTNANCVACSDFEDK